MQLSGMHLVKDHHEHQLRGESGLAHTPIGSPQLGQVETENNRADSASEIVFVQTLVNVLPGRRVGSPRRRSPMSAIVVGSVRVEYHDCDLGAAGLLGWKIPAITDFRAEGTIMGLAGLTAVFGMGTGVTPPVWSPEKRPAGGQAGPGPVPSMWFGGSATHVTVAVSVRRTLSVITG